MTDLYNPALSEKGPGRFQPGRGFHQVLLRVDLRLEQISVVRPEGHILRTHAIGNHTPIYGV
jgi:hypothetical protein